MSPDEYGGISLKDLDLKYRGWTELREIEMRDRWERARMIALSSVTNPTFKGPKSGSDFDRIFKNPYAPKKKETGYPMTIEEVNERIKRFDQLEFKEYNGG